MPHSRVWEEAEITEIILRDQNKNERNREDMNELLTVTKSDTANLYHCVQ